MNSKIIEKAIEENKPLEQAQQEFIQEQQEQAQEQENNKEYLKFMRSQNIEVITWQD